MDQLKLLSQNHQQEKEEGDGNGRNEGTLPKPFMGVKARRLASFRTAVKGVYLDLESNAFLSDILSKRGKLISYIDCFLGHHQKFTSIVFAYLGDQKLLFADRIIKLTGSGKIKQRAMMITDRAIYLADMDSCALRRRISLASIDRLCLSKLKDNFFALIIPTEYDCLMASTRKNEIVSILVEATKIKPSYEIGVVFSNR